MTFKKLPDDQKRSTRIPVLMTQAEYAAVQHRATSKGLSVAELARQAVLSRCEKTDTQYEQQVVSELRVLTEGLRLIRDNYLSKGIEPPAEGLNLYIQEVVDMIRGISK